MSDQFIAPLTGDQLEQIVVEPPPKPATKNTGSKKIWIIVGAVVCLLLLAGGVYGAMKLVGGNEAASPTPEPEKRRVVEPTNVITVGERPYVAIIPAADGRNLTLRVVSLSKLATSAEYELEYQAGELLQGVNGALDLSSLPASTTQLMGSCSAGGKCSYHEDVRGGSLLIKFLGSENFSLKQDWKYIDNKAKEDAVASKDAKFQLTSPALKTNRYIIIYNTPGVPPGLEGTLVSDPYSLQTSSALAGDGTLTMRATTEGNLVIAGFDGSEWHEFTGTVDGKMITADVELMELYVVVSK